jgi:hypothetical protein
MQMEEVSLLVAQFENCTLPKSKWTHEAHFIMALWYCCNLPLPQAIQTIRNGIKKYNVSVGGENSDMAGYHETITLFYTATIANYLLTTGITTLTDEQMAVFLQQPFLAKDYPLNFYSKELLMSKEARRNWIRPDKKPGIL